MITPGHGQSRTNASLSGPVGLQRPEPKGVIEPLPCVDPGDDTVTEAGNPPGRGA